MRSYLDIGMYCLGVICLTGMAAAVAYLILDTVRPNWSRICAELARALFPTRASGARAPHSPARARAAAAAAVVDADALAHVDCDAAAREAA